MVGRTPWLWAAARLRGAHMTMYSTWTLRDGEPAAKLPVNLGDNPYDVADRCAETFLLR